MYSLISIGVGLAHVLCVSASSVPVPVGNSLPCDEEVLGSIVTRSIAPVVETFWARFQIDNRKSTDIPPRNPYSSMPVKKLQDWQVQYSIPKQDYILTILPQLDRVRTGLNRLYVSDIGSALPPLKEAALLLRENVERESTCDTRDCSDTREIIKQASLRFDRLLDGDNSLELEKLRFIYNGLHLGIVWVRFCHDSVCFRTDESDAKASTGPVSSAAPVAVRSPRRRIWTNETDTRSFIDFIHSDIYAEITGHRLMPSPCYEALGKKFQNLASDELFEGILHGHCDPANPLPGYPRNAHHKPAVDPHPRPDNRAIPVYDYIASSIVAESVRDITRMFLDPAQHSPEMVVDIRDVNLKAYELMVDLNQKSTCEFTDCLVFKQIVTQFHFALTRMISMGAMRLPDVRPIRVLGEVVSLLEQRREEIHSMMKFVPPETPEIEESTSCSSWFCCFGRRPPLREYKYPCIVGSSLRLQEELLGFSNFKKFAVHLVGMSEAILDEISTVPEFETRLLIFQDKIAFELIALSRSIMKYIPPEYGGWSRSVPDMMFELVEMAEQAKSVAHWPPLKQQAILSCAMIRRTLSELGVLVHSA